MAAIITRQYAQRKCWTVDDGRIFVDDGISPNDYEKRLPCRSANNARDVARANRAIRLAAPEQRSNSSVDATVRRGRCRVKATRRDHVTEGNLCIVDAAATSSDLELVLGIPNGPASVHQLVDQLYRRF